MYVPDYAQFGGRHVESANLKNLLAHTGTVNPATGQPLSEALCFGIAGGIGAGYSWCPSVLRYGQGSGVAIVGRHRIYATSATWYEGFCDRLGIRTRITETGGPGKAYQNLVEELKAGRPTVVWCLRPKLPFLVEPISSCGLWMHSFIIYAIDEKTGQAYGADRAATRVTISLDDLAAARRGVCSHKNRTLSIDPPAALTTARLKDAIRAGIRACAQEMLKGQMKTYSLPGFEKLARILTNDKSKDGWLKVFKGGLLYWALRDVFDSIETFGTGGGLFRPLYADFLDEAAGITKDRAFAELAGRYRELGQQWAALAEAALPGAVKSFQQTRELLREKCKVFEEKGDRAAGTIREVWGKLQAIETEMRPSLPLTPTDARALLEGLRERLLVLHQTECATAADLQKAAV
jgi:hypothetical protein